ncbi:hypothetical protein OG203_24945 [Nocardia sp. NBC_01499]|uniref:hypothetical protein n=1 Tax=Nocardia sp. NBC_01499 TaxID=2903597 RepID=UPI003867F2A0
MSIARAGVATAMLVGGLLGGTVGIGAGAALAATGSLTVPDGEKSSGDHTITKTGTASCAGSGKATGTVEVIPDAPNLSRGSAKIPCNGKDQTWTVKMDLDTSNQGNRQTPDPEDCQYAIELSVAGEKVAEATSDCS